MSVKMMIIDGQADFRSLLMHHVTTHWPDAILSAYDPTVAGHLPDEFSGAGNDIVLLGDAVGERKGLEILKQFCKTPGFPAVAYFGQEDEEADPPEGHLREGRHRRASHERGHVPYPTFVAPEW